MCIVKWYRVVYVWFHFITNTNKTDWIANNDIGMHEMMTELVCLLASFGKAYFFQPQHYSSIRYLSDIPLISQTSTPVVGQWARLIWLRLVDDIQTSQPLSGVFPYHTSRAHMGQLSIVITDGRWSTAEGMYRHPQECNYSLLVYYTNQQLHLINK